MGNDLERLVVTDAHRRSVRAISEHSLVLLLGAPAAGKSTIGASIAIGAADIWQNNTIRATSPEDIQRHLSPEGSQFFWIDDAWGNTQYQQQTAERWNQVFPLMQGAMRRNTRFLITSRDYIWRAAQRDLKLSAMPTLRQSQVIINVQELSSGEKAQMLYNHIKFGDQPRAFKAAVKEHLPGLAERKDFLPETARRLGSQFFSRGLKTDAHSVATFFAHPQAYLLDTIAGLSADCRAAIAVVFLNGGNVRSPVPAQGIAAGATAFGVSDAAVREQLDALNGSLLLLAQDEQGSFWTYKHPTVSDAFAKYLAANPELIEIYLRGAKPESVIQEVVCAGIKIEGAPLVIPDTLHAMLAEKLSGLDRYPLKNFVIYRSNRPFTQAILELRPDLLKGFSSFISPVKDDSDSILLARLHKQGLLSEDVRRRFASTALQSLEEEADSSIFDSPEIRDVLTQNELHEAHTVAKFKVLNNISGHVERVKDNWDSDYAPDDHFDNLMYSIRSIANAVTGSYKKFMDEFDREVRMAVDIMARNYEPTSSTSAPIGSSTPSTSGMGALFRDVDE
ncbi:hypothetical protein [Sphingomonas sp.]|uniref:nSTAND3 domain-containing NTPase n=1 Tax=Sphingomonas sp. TaxID=28214 RepID=UPI003F71FECF